MSAAPVAWGKHINGGEHRTTLTNIRLCWKGLRGKVDAVQATVFALMNVCFLMSLTAKVGMPLDPVPSHPGRDQGTWPKSGRAAGMQGGGPNSQSHPGFLRVSSVQAAVHFPASTPARLSASGFRPSGHTGITSPPIPGPSGPWLLNETSHALPRKTRAVLIQQDFTRRRALTTWNIYPKRP